MERRKGGHEGVSRQTRESSILTLLQGRHRPQNEHLFGSSRVMVVYDDP